MKSKAGFSITELAVVLAIVLVVSGLSLPSISRTIDAARLNSAAQQVASLYEQARIRASQDNNYYSLLVSPAAAQPAKMCIDLDANAVCGPADPQAQLTLPVALNNNGIPTPMDATTLGFTPLLTETSSTFDQQGNAVAALEFNSRGVPCQRASSTSPCIGPVGWVQYLQLQRPSNDSFFAAVSVSPTGRIRIWKYAPSGGGGRSWF